MDCVRTLYRTATANTPAKRAMHHYRLVIILHITLLQRAREHQLRLDQRYVYFRRGFLLFSVIPQRLRVAEIETAASLDAPNVSKRAENAPIPATRPRRERKSGIMMIRSSAMETRTQGGSRLAAERTTTRVA